ncbi:MAG: hypothetical protein WBM56_13630 [Robiginitalea sp.]|uniref:hypothetical protein n=1 Tax=Robiginitalea sp. TaxID=1902411 RepID=UPI003C7611B5
MSQLNDFLVIDTLRVGNLRVEPKRVRATYTVTKPDGNTSEKELVYSYEQALFDPHLRNDWNLASMMLAQVALNYGLFCKNLILEGVFDATDRSFLRNMLENTSREILTNKLLIDNPFLKSSFRNLEIEPKKSYTQAKLIFEASKEPVPKSETNYPAPDYSHYAILSSGGKDSLLTYGLVRELGVAHPVFINEAGRHWFTAVNAYRYFKETEPNTVKPWCNSDRIFNWMLKHFEFIREDYSGIPADMYPIRLWTVGVFLFGVLPVALKKGVGNVLIGNEYDSTIRGRTKGIGHYAGLYDQSWYFDNTLTKYYRKKGWMLRQYSCLRSTSELLIMKILISRYPELQKQQISCHAAHEASGRMLPCGKCEKCRRIIGMMIALDADPRRCGYTDKQIEWGLHQLTLHPIKQIDSDAGHLYHLLLQKGAIIKNPHTQKLARPHPEILKIRFDTARSRLADLPNPVREPLFRILESEADGSVKKTAGEWNTVALTPEFLMNDKYTPYAL